MTPKCPRPEAWLPQVTPNDPATCSDTPKVTSEEMASQLCAPGVDHQDLTTLKATLQVMNRTRALDIVPPPAVLLARLHPRRADFDLVVNVANAFLGDGTMMPRASPPPRPPAPPPPKISTTPRKPNHPNRR